MTMRIVAYVLILVVLSPATRAQPTDGAPAVSGEVLAPDGTPVTGGTIALMTFPNNRVTATIDKTGRFRIVAASIGESFTNLFISVPGYAPYRAGLDVPRSGKMSLPAIVLREAVYVRVRFVATDGEVLPAAGLRRRVIDADGLNIPDPLGHEQMQVEQDGSITIGPLPHGRLLLAYDRAPLAPTRLPDISVTGSEPLIDRGTITIAAARTMQVDVLDGNDRPVPSHDVWLEDAAQPSALPAHMVKTNEQGRAIFDRVGSARYRVTTRTSERCLGKQFLNVSRLASAGSAPLRMVIGGRATFRIITALGPLNGRSVVASPDAPGEPPWASRLTDTGRGRGWPIVPRLAPASCGAATDAAGRITLTGFPPGAADLRISLFNSTYITRVAVPENGREVAVTVPDGLMPVRVTNQATGRAVAAQLVWTGAGGRVEANANANGDALLEAVGTAGGTLTIAEPDYQTVEGKFDETPGTLQEVALLRLPSARLSVRVSDAVGAPVADAVVQLIVSSVSDFAATDDKGVAMFTDVPTGALRLTAHATGFAPSTIHVLEERRENIEIRVK